jgi:hypothetical protein
MMRTEAWLRLSVVSIAVFAAACGSSSPSAPTPPPSQNPPPSSGPFTLTGRVVGTVTGMPIAGATVTVGGQAFTTDRDGAFTMTADTSDVRHVVISGNGVIRRESRLSVGARNVTLDVIQDRPPFNLSFFRTFARNAVETDSGLEPLRPLRSAPRIRLRTVDARGRSIEPAILDLVEAALRDAAPIWSAGRFPLEVVERGVESRRGQAGWITIEWPNPPDLTTCGRATVGTTTGYIELHHRNPDCWCGTPELFSPMVVRHELGHVYGYWHTDSPSDVMDGGEWTDESCDLRASSREIEHAKFMYSRTTGNTDPDTDPSGTVLREPPVIVIDN